MDSHDNETTNELLRNMWQQLVATHNALCSRIDALNASVSSRIDDTNARLAALAASVTSRIDGTNARLDSFQHQTNENFGRVQRNFERVFARLEGLETRETRMNELDERLTRVETHVGLRDE